MDTIHELAKHPERASDKGNPDHAFNGQTYLHHYARHFEPMRERPVKLLEIGVYGGWSLRLWREYFPKGDIHGLDINPECKEHKGERITVHIGDQSNLETLAEMSKLGPWDIVIDDGSHYVPHMLTTFAALWPFVAPGGLYVMEDMRLSYQNVDMTWPGMANNTTIQDGRNDRSLLNEFLYDTVRLLDMAEGTVAGVHLYSMIYFLQKTL